MESNRAAADKTVERRCRVMLKAVHECVCTLSAFFSETGKTCCI